MFEASHKKEKIGTNNKSKEENKKSFISTVFIL